MRDAGYSGAIDSPSGCPSMSNFREFDRETRFLLPPSLDEWLPEQHLARFVVEVIDGLDLSAMVKSYRGTGSAGYHPVLLLGLLVYGYATGRLRRFASSKSYCYCQVRRPGCELAIDSSRRPNRFSIQESNDSRSGKTRGS